MGYGNSTKGGVIEVTKGALVVMKWERAFMNLYKLICETVKWGAFGLEHCRGKTVMDGREWEL